MGILDQIIDRFYEVNVSDPMIKGFFEGRDIDAIKRMNFCMIRAALSGSELDCDVDLKQTHSGLCIEFVHFERYLRNFFCVLRDFEVNEDDIEYILALVDYFRDQIVINHI